MMSISSVQPDIIGCILSKVVQPSCPVEAIKTMKRLACSCRSLHQKVNSLMVVHLFLNAMSNTWALPEEEIAAAINTVGARRWLWNYMQQNGLCDAYQSIQEIYALGKGYLSDRNDYPSSYFFSSTSTEFHTKQGFELFISNGQANSIGTPFGRIIFQDIHKPPALPLEFFLIKFTIAFDRIEGNDFEEKIKEIDEEGRSKIISQHDLEGKKGSCHLFLSKSNFSIYHIVKVNGKEMPAVIRQQTKAHLRSHKLVLRMWEILDSAWKNPIVV